MPHFTPLPLFNCPLFCLDSSYYLLPSGITQVLGHRGNRRRADLNIIFDIFIVSAFIQVNHKIHIKPKVLSSSRMRAAGTRRGRSIFFPFDFIKYISKEIKSPTIKIPFNIDPKPNTRSSKNTVIPKAHLRAVDEDINRIDNNQNIPPIISRVIGK
ncbi:hypothetical protein COY48_04660 [Candidatus Collierbacteria bacterium CG_4_10_14_0_8_um_filter_43_86]|nr:MAG: hypothetical protein COY48_04660 [Candidatus Collierbacteria bacterium CG_4_10_14_0_8_um_filter_43_86]